jgi:hypothetical protein
MNPAIFPVGMTEARATLLVRVSASLKTRLAEMAERERRSLSKQVELLLEQCLEDLPSKGVGNIPQQKAHRRKPGSR